MLKNVCPAKITYKILTEVEKARGSIPADEMITHRGVVAAYYSYWFN